MPYITTKLQPIKSYPTFQFYAKAVPKSVGLDIVFKICILETLKWIRTRLNDFPDKPPQIMVPEPEMYESFSIDSLCSFSYSNGLNLDVIYIEKKGIWSFRITETDMGANLGSPNERPPVSGRTFDTEISFVKQKDHVEAGIRTICSEPSDSTADCEVFRPTVLKALAENPYIKLTHGGFVINKSPLEVKTKSDAERLFSLYENEELNFPLVIVCDTETREVRTDISAFKFDETSFSYKGSLSLENVSELPVDLSSFSFSNTQNTKNEKSKKTREKTVLQKNDVKKEKAPVFDYKTLADKLVGFAVVAFIDETLIKYIDKKLQASLEYGKIVVIRNKNIIDSFEHKEQNRDTDKFFRELRSEMIAMPKRKQYYFGGVVFHSDAKLKDFHTKRHETNSLEEQCHIYRLELDELRKQVKELSQHQTDMQQTADALRSAQKKAESLQKELDAKQAEFDILRENAEQKQSAYQKSSGLIAFYKAQIETASSFPTRKDDVCDWIEKQYSDNIILTSRARSEMKKYSGPLDIVSLCDGIVFIDAYARYRKHSATEEELQLYAERNNWEVQSCGKETLRVRKSDYTVTYGDRQYITDLHIKHGVKTEELIRIYFCWDDSSKKVIIGSMPEHLATVKQNT